jgi:DeoR/GlpR family transcriptional regulator of sugar metabolism
MINESELLEFIRLRKTASTKDISEAFHASESTVRRALTRLERKRNIEKYHGGAHYVDKQAVDHDVISRKEKNWKKKNAIARAASKYVRDNTTVILLGGTTVCAMCQYLKHKSLTVITNSLIVYDELKYEKNIKLILLGGEYNPVEREVGGTLTNNGMKHIRADYVFSGATSFDEKQGATTEDLGSVELYRTCISSSEEVYILIDSTKFKGRGTAVTAYYNEISCLVTDDELDPEVKQRLTNRGLNIVTVN